MQVFVPFPAADFKRTSVGFGWNAVFDEVLSHARTSVTVLSAQLPARTEEPEAYARCNRAVRQAAGRQADLMDQSPRLLAVWNGRPGDGPGGATDAVAEWRSSGLPKPRIVDPGTVSSPGEGRLR